MVWLNKTPKQVETVLAFCEGDGVHRIKVHRCYVNGEWDCLSIGFHKLFRGYAGDPDRCFSEYVGHVVWDRGTPAPAIPQAYTMAWNEFLALINKNGGWK